MINFDLESILSSGLTQHTQIKKQTLANIKPGYNFWVFEGFWVSLESLASWQWGSLRLVCGSRLIVSCLHFIHHSPTTCQANQARYHSILI